MVARLRDDYQKLHDQPIYDPGEQEARYREIEASEPRQALKEAMDEWCAVWFWPTDEESLRHVPTPETFHAEPSDARSSIIRQLASDLKFFHWELEFPDVFTPERSGFDALIGNPPWDVMKPNSQEFFTDFDPLYRTYDKQAALRRQRELFQTVPGRDRAVGRVQRPVQGSGQLGQERRRSIRPGTATGQGRDRALAAVWARRRQERQGFADPEHPFRLQGSADLNSYKMFAEVFWNLLKADGRLGVILPTGIYSDFGTKDLRETLLYRGRLDFLYAFQNEKKIFSAADHRYKQVVLFATRVATRSRSAPGSAWAWVTRPKPTRSPTTYCGTTRRRWSSRPTTCGRTARSRSASSSYAAPETWRSSARFTTTRSASVTTPLAGRSPTPESST